MGGGYGLSLKQHYNKLCIFNILYMIFADISVDNV